MSDTPTPSLARPGRRSQAHPGRMPGRPLAINQIIDRDDQGNPVLARRRFLDVISLGEPVSIAAECAGLTKHTVSRLLSQGAILAHYIAQGRRDPATLTNTEQDLLAFSRDFTTASTRGQTLLAGLRNRMMRGGTVLRTTTTVTRQTPEGEETVTTVREETLGPSERMLMWHAERSKPDAFGTHLRVIVDSPPALFEPSDEDRLAFLVDDAAAFVDEHPDVIDVEEAS